MTQVVALISLLCFIALMSVIGITTARQTKTMHSFLLGGRNIGPWVSAFAYGTSYFSAVIFIGYAGKHGWDIGFGAMWIGIGNAILGSLAAWLLLAKRTRRMTQSLGASTMPELFEARYGSRNMKIYSAIIIFIFLVPYAATVYKGLGSLFSAVFPSLQNNALGISPELICMFIIAVLTSFYLVLGGYVATAITDFVQGIIMLIGVVVMIYAIVSNDVVGGISNGIRQIREINPQLTSIWGGDKFSFLMTNILLTSFGTWGLPQMVHKFYAIKDESSIQKATIVSTVFALVIGCGAYFVGTFGRLYLNNTLPAGGYDAVIPNLLLNALSSSVWTNVVLSVVLLLVLSASMSTLAAVVLTSSSAISVDLLQVIKPNYDEKKQMVLMRILCFVFVALSFLFAALNISIIVSIMSFSWGVVSGCFIGPYIWGLYSKKITKAGAWCGMLSGLVVVGSLIIYSTITSGFKTAISGSATFGVIAMAVSIIIVPVVSFFTKKVPNEIVENAFSISE